MVRTTGSWSGRFRPGLLAGMMVACGGTAGLMAAASDARPNILFIAIDDLNDWPAALSGHPDARTPHIDRLARRGTLFADTHCQFPLCGPSRASVMTGLRPTTLGLTHHLGDDELLALSRRQNTLLLHEYFGQAGYKTMAVGKICHDHVPAGTVDLSGGREPFGPRPKPDYNWVGEKTSTDWHPWPAQDTDTPDYRTAQWTIDRLGEQHDRPFLLMTGFLRPHVPWFVPPRWFRLQQPAADLVMPPYDPQDWDDIPAFARTVVTEPQYPTTDWAIEHEQWRHIVRAYLACVSFVDHYVGKILDALDASAHADNTLVILWSDHGYHLGEKGLFKKVTLWERSTRVPLMIAGPGVSAGQVCERVTSLLDIYPTLVDLCGLPPNLANEGHSLRPLLDDPAADWNRPAVTTLLADNHSVITAKYHYIRYEDGSEELYDRRRDPHEWRNLAGQPGSEAIRQRLAGSLTR